MRFTVLLSSLMLVASVSAGAVQQSAAALTVVGQATPVATPTLVPVCRRADCV